jgi:DNA-binding transcriptional MerR regulator
MKSKGAFKTIGEVCEIVGLIDPETGKKKTHVLRFWEKHFKEIKPSLIYKGRRYYSEKNIDYVKKIKKLLKEEGYTIKGSKKVLLNKNIPVDTNSDDNISTDKLINLKNKIKELKKYLNG